MLGEFGFRFSVYDDLAMSDKQFLVLSLKRIA